MQNIRLAKNRTINCLECLHQYMPLVNWKCALFSGSLCIKFRVLFTTTTPLTINARKKLTPTVKLTNPDIICLYVILTAESTQTACRVVGGAMLWEGRNSSIGYYGSGHIHLAKLQAKWLIVSYAPFALKLLSSKMQNSLDMLNNLFITDRNCYWLLLC